MATSIISEAQQNYGWTHGQSKLKEQLFSGNKKYVQKITKPLCTTNINVTCNITDRPTDKVNY